MDKLDTMEEETDGGSGCGEGGGGMGGGEDTAFSYIWISNSPQGTVSKINTKTAIEEARYNAGPNADPSRTSVNLFGDVVVVDRNGGIAKIAVKEERCIDTNGQPGIQTSTGAADILPWGADECVVWHQPLPGTGNTGPRPVAWEGVDLDTNCPVANPRVWVGWYDQGSNQGGFRRLDGDTGQTLDEVTIPWSGETYGPYGGAVNREGDFWVLGWNSGPLVRIDADDLTYEVIQIPAPPGGSKFVYGMALDKEGNPWFAGSSQIYNYEVGTGQFHFMTGGTSNRGLQVDKEGRAFVATPGGMVVIDTATRQVIGPNVQVAGALSPVGVSIDADGYVWLVDQSGSQAFKVNPETYQAEAVVSGLVSPYTYSDMTGAGLDLVTNPPQG